MFSTNKKNYSLSFRTIKSILSIVLLLNLIRFSKSANDKVSVCTSVLEFPDIGNLPVICDEISDAYYKNFPEKYFNILQLFGKAISAMNNNVGFACKFSIASNNTDFSLRLVGQTDELHQPRNGSFSTPIWKHDIVLNSVEIFPSMIRESNNFPQHLRGIFQSSFLVARNKALYKNDQARAMIDADKKIKLFWTSSPCVNEKDETLFEIYKRALHSLNAVTLYVIELSPSRTMSVGLENYEKLKERYASFIIDFDGQGIYGSLEKFARKYIPKIHYIEKSYLWMFKHGYIDRDKNILVESFEFFDIGTWTALHATQLNFNANTVTIIAQAVPAVQGIDDRIKAAILDGLNVVQLAFKGVFPDDATEACEGKFKILDPLLHGVYGEYPELFEFLFPEIYAYHHNVNQPLYAQCLERHGWNAQAKKHGRQASVSIGKNNQSSEKNYRSYSM